MTKLTKKQKDLVLDLAIAYDALNDAYALGKASSVGVWSNMLLNAQAALGVELYSEALIRSMVDSVKPQKSLAD